MKRLLMIVLGFCVAVVAVAQFNTVCSSKARHGVVAGRSVYRSKGAGGSGAVSTKGKGDGGGLVAVRRGLVGRYLGVAYPLGRIVVTSGFGMRWHPVLRRRMWHGGVDLRARFEEVYSVMDGVVTGVGSDRRAGRYVTVGYAGGYSCSFCHLSRALVCKGDSVCAGEVIGISGDSGMASGPHLHLSVRDGTGRCIDPLALLEYIGRVREEVVRVLCELEGRY